MPQLWFLAFLPALVAAAAPFSVLTPAPAIANASNAEDGSGYFEVSGTADMSWVDPFTTISYLVIRCAALIFSPDTATIFLGLGSITGPVLFGSPSSGVTFVTRDVFIETPMADATSNTFNMVFTPLYPWAIYAVKCGATYQLNKTDSAFDTPVFASPNMVLAATPLEGQSLACQKAIESQQNPLAWSTPGYPWQNMDAYSGKLGGRNAGDFFGCSELENTTYCLTIITGNMWTGYCTADVCDTNVFRTALAAAYSSEIIRYASIDLQLLQYQGHENYLDEQIAALLNTTVLDVAAIANPLLDQITAAALGLSLPRLMALETAQILNSYSSAQCYKESPSVPSTVWVWAAPIIILAAACILATFLDRNLSLIHRLQRTRSAVPRSELLSKLIHNPDDVLLTKSIEDSNGKSSKDWQGNSAIGSLIKHLSLSRNYASLVDSRGGSLDFFDGIRFVSACWVILGHTEIFSIFLGSGAANTGELVSTKGDGATLWYQIVPGGFFAVDLFFWIAGFFSTFVMLSKIRKVSTKTFAAAIPMLYLKRYLRLLPAILLVLGAYWLLLPAVADGPFTIFPTGVNEACEKYWWTEVLFITAWKPKEWLNCLGVTWFLTCDFFYFTISPFIVMIHAASSRVGIILTLALLTVTLAYYLQQSHHYRLAASLLDQNPGDQGFNMTYYKPETRAGAYLVGTLFGMFYDFADQKIRKRTPGTEKPNFKVLTLWQSHALQYLGLLIILLCVFGVYDLIHNLSCLPISGPVNCPHPNRKWSQSTTDFYNVFSRSGFALGCSLIASAWIWGPPTFFKWLFSRPLMAPLGKLSFLAYLWHMFFVQWFYSSQHAPLYYSRVNILVWFTGFVTIAFSVSLVSYLFFEIPIANVVNSFLKIVEDKFMGKKSRQ